ncbi:TPA: hypothetical protein DEG21_05280 [Patescibacteria group bacterium]|nr:hypothetical protein [Candidatus Gracilibacteria bacterium]HBY75241.1 hypothetical protein [Candidatus Gracilibacteria bacterium]
MVFAHITCLLVVFLNSTKASDSGALPEISLIVQLRVRSVLAELRVISTFLSADTSKLQELYTGHIHITDIFKLYVPVGTFLKTYELCHLNDLENQILFCLSKISAIHSKFVRSTGTQSQIKFNVRVFGGAIKKFFQTIFPARFASVTFHISQYSGENAFRIYDQGFKRRE